MTPLDLLLLLIGIWLGRRTTRGGPALWHARNELTIARARTAHAEYLLDLSRTQQADHLAVCPLHRADHGDAA